MLVIHPVRRSRRMTFVRRGAYLVYFFGVTMQTAPPPAAAQALLASRLLPCLPPCPVIWKHGSGCAAIAAQQQPPVSEIQTY